jgi:FkbM family methyltransferase
MINWSSFDYRSLTGRLLRLPARALPAGTVMSIRRGPARRMKWIAGSAIHGCWLGTYELDKQAALQRFVQPGMTVYDIGAQAGFYTLFFSRFVGDRGRVFAFEPCPYEARFLLDHVRINKLVNVRVILAAVAEQAGLVAMSTDQGMTQNRIYHDTDTALIVPSVNLDSLALPAPDLVKMDVEGAESAVLSGAQRTLHEARPVVFVALHSDQQRKICATLLRDAGYTIYALDGAPLEGAIAVDEIYARPLSD